MQDEWYKHASKFALRWLVSMNDRGKLDNPRVSPDLSLRRKVLPLARDGQERDAVMKDLPLIEAARATERLIASRDDTARRRFARYSESVTELCNVSWVNPDRLIEENLIQWLRQGAPNEKSRELGSHEG
jgi:hypothetical protein